MPAYRLETADRFVLIMKVAMFTLPKSNPVDMLGHLSHVSEKQFIQSVISVMNVLSTSCALECD